MLEDREDIEEVRDRLGPTPRKRSLLEFLFLRGYTPTWFLQTGAFADVSGKQGMLLRHGNVVWATIVQANQFLFKSGLWNHPATIAYSPDPCFDGDIAGLTSIGHRLAGLKHTAPADPEEQKYARMIT